MHSLGAVVLTGIGSRSVQTALERKLEPWRAGARTPGWKRERPRFDYFVLGGRWHGLFMAKDEVVDSNRLVRRTREVQWEEEVTYAPDGYDAGPAGYLDFNKLRAASVEQTARRWDRWEAATAGCPVPQPLRVFRERVVPGPSGYSHERAWDDYMSQPAVVAARATDEFMFDAGTLVDEFSGNREQALADAAVRATNVAVLVTAEGQWITPDDRVPSSMHDGTELGFARYVGTHLKKLDPDALVAFVDFKS